MISEIGEQRQDSNAFSANKEFNASRSRRELLRRPSYKKILKDLTGVEIEFSPGSAIQSHTTSISAHSNVIYSPSNDTNAEYPSPNGQFFLSNELGKTFTGPGQKFAALSVSNDQIRKRELRLLKNREAARECRRKKKEYIKCLENRVTILENQNKALIEELKSLKELYCKQHVD